MTAFQDFYPEHLAHCYGCGRLNEHGYHIATEWDGEESLTRFTPQPFHTAVAGFVYGGLLASLIDCHSTGTAAAQMYRGESRAMTSSVAGLIAVNDMTVPFLRRESFATRLGPYL